jgi:hypothetical protein
MNLPAMIIGKISSYYIATPNNKIAFANNTQFLLPNELCNKIDKNFV